MELRVLKYFLAVAREESITAAAESMHISQPTLSKQLMELEDELGKKLFTRGNRKISLTEEGIFLRKRAQEIVDLADKTESEFLCSDDAIAGDIYIGGGETPAIRLITKVCKKLSARYPEIRYHIFSGSGEEVSERLDKGVIDFGIFVGNAILSKYDYLRLPMHDTWGLLMRKDSPLAAKKSINPEDIKDIPIMCSRQVLARNDLSGWLGSSFDKLNIVATYNLIYNVSVMVEEGMGYALCLDGLIDTFGNQELCFRPFEPLIKADLVIAWMKYQVFSKAAEKFLEALQSEQSIAAE